ncbi:MAG: hypothetical protein ACUZ8H_01605 [Candidatus Anammoxibacter sp.]
MKINPIEEIIDQAYLEYISNSNHEPDSILINWYDLIKITVSFSKLIDFNEDEIDYELMKYRGMKFIGSEQIKRGVVLITKGYLKL